MAQVKFYRMKDSEIRKVALVDENDSKKVVAIIGKVDELIRIGLLYPNRRMNRNAWVIIDRNDGADGTVGLVHYNTLDEVKQIARETYKA